MKLLFVWSFACLVNVSLSLLCSELREAPTDKKLDLAELQTMPPKEISQCLAHLGKEQLNAEESNFIWDSLIRLYEGVENIPDDKLTHLHWVTVALTPEDINNMTIDNVDVITNFGNDYNLSPSQLTAIAEKVKEDWGGKEPEDYTGYDLIALKQILCYFNRSEIEKIHAKAYREAASVLGKLKNCNLDVLNGLATLAMQDKAFGSPKNWSQAIIETVGIVAKGLPGEYRFSVTPEPLQKSVLQNESQSNKSNT